MKATGIFLVALSMLSLMFESLLLGDLKRTSDMVVCGLISFVIMFIGFILYYKSEQPESKPVDNFDGAGMDSADYKAMQEAYKNGDLTT